MPTHQDSWTGSPTAASGPRRPASRPSASSTPARSTSCWRGPPAAPDPRNAPRRSIVAWATIHLGGYSHDPISSVPSMPLTPSTDVRRARDRFATNFGWLDSKHSFSFGQHYDPHNTHFGLLLVNNDDVVDPGTGFETHPHRDMEIVTWVLRGQLVHQDSEGHNGLIYPGLAQRMSAGTGILHSEKNDSW